MFEKGDDVIVAAYENTVGGTLVNIRTTKNDPTGKAIDTTSLKYICGTATVLYDMGNIGVARAIGLHIKHATRELII